jgi:hypothetical protein
MDRNTATMSMHTAFLGAGVALWQLLGSAAVAPANVPVRVDPWPGLTEAVTCVAEDVPEDYWSRCAALLLETSGGEGTALAPGC